MSDILSLDYQSSWEEFQRNERVKELPIRVRIGLRDQYYKPDHTVAKALDSLRSELGGLVEMKIDWGKLWSVIDTEFPDNSTFVPAMSSVATSFIEAVKYCITSADESWGDTLLERMKAQGKTVLELYLLVDTTIMSAKALYMGQNASLALKLPKAGPGTYCKYEHMRIVPQLLNVFKDAAEAEQAGQEPEWVDAGIDDVKIPQLERPFAASTTTDKFPDVEATARPDLLMDRPPYLATIRSGAIVEVTCSHPRTLDFLATYLENHASVNPNQTGGLRWWKVERHDSRFGNGLVFDKVTIEENRTNWGLRPTPMLALALLQGTLGYEVLHTDGNCWVLKREAGFAPR